MASRPPKRCRCVEQGRAPYLIKSGSGRIYCQRCGEWASEPVTDAEKEREAQRDRT